MRFVEGRRSLAHTGCLTLAIVFVIGSWSAYMWFMFFGPGLGLANGISDLPRLGQFGDAFGAFNALCSALAFACLFVAVLIQRAELHNQQREMAIQRHATETTLKLQILTTFWQQYQGLGHAINLLYQHCFSPAMKAAESGGEYYEETVGFITRVLLGKISTHGNVVDEINRLSRKEVVQALAQLPNRYMGAGGRRPLEDASLSDPESLNYCRRAVSLFWNFLGLATRQYTMLRAAEGKPAGGSVRAQAAVPVLSAQEVLETFRVANMLPHLVVLERSFDKAMMGERQPLDKPGLWLLCVVWMRANPGATPYLSDREGLLATLEDELRSVNWLVVRGDDPGALPEGVRGVPRAGGQPNR